MLQKFLMEMNSESISLSRGLIKSLTPIFIAIYASNATLTPTGL